MTHNNKTKIDIRCGNIIDLTENEIKKSVTPFILDNIRQSGNNKLYAFIGLHEGHFKIQDLNTGKPVMLTLTKAGLTSAYNKIKIGTPLIEGHRQGMDDDIESIGAIVGKFIKGQNLVIVCHGEALNKFTSVSVEMQTMEKDDEIDEVSEVYCFAMLNKNQRPALYNAHKVKELVAQEPGETTEEIKSNIKERKMTLNEIKEKIKEGGYLPSQLFAVEELQKDSNYKDLLSAQERINVELQSVKELLQGKEAEIAKIHSMEKLNTLLTDGYSEGEIKFIKYKAKKEDVANPEEFIKNAIEEYKEFAPTPSPVNETVDTAKEAPLPSSWNTQTKSNSLDASTKDGMNAIREILMK